MIPLTPVFVLERALFRFINLEPFSIRHACEGVQIFSGKTFGSGAALAKSFLRAGWSGLILSTKKDKLNTRIKYANETGRQDRMRVFNATGRWCISLLQLEGSLAGGGSSIILARINE